MVKRLFNQKFYIITIFVLIIAEPSISSWLYLFLQQIYNSVTVGTPHSEVLRLLFIGILIWIVKRLLLYAIAVVKSRFICNIKQDLKRDVFSGLLGLKTANISQIASTGEYLSVFTNDITIIEQRFFSNVIGLISSVFSIIILGGTFLTMNRKLAMYVFAFGILVMFVPTMFSKKLNKSSLVYSNSLSKFTQKLKEFLVSYSTIKNYSVESVILEKFNIINQETEDAKFKYDCSLSLADSIGSLLAWFSRIMVIGVGLVMVADGAILLGTVVAAQAFADELASPLQSIVENINSIKSVKSIVKKIYDITTESDKNLIQEEHRGAYQNSDLEVEFEHLSINIRGKKIISDFSFKFENGKKYLVVGRNGSGKSSLFKVLKKRFSDYSGNIYINGQNIKEIKNDQLSQLVTYLNENVAIFSGTVQENITLWRKINEGQFDVATEQAHIELDPQREVKEDGVNISSGEQRRIEIARSLLSSAKVMIFDEVVSTLDIETAYDIEEATLGYHDKTVIFISHNFSGKLIRKYDEILVMKDGCLVSHGNYDTLIDECEYFRRICEIKFGLGERM